MQYKRMKYKAVVFFFILQSMPQKNTKYSYGIFYLAYQYSECSENQLATFRNK